jgi:hypothetical protein
MTSFPEEEHSKNLRKAERHLRIEAVVVPRVFINETDCTAQMLKLALQTDSVSQRIYRQLSFI